MAPARGKPADADPADASRRVDAVRSMPSRASRGDDDVGALTPARAPGTSGDTASQERARAGLESIRRADAAVEAARETARARAAERASARAEAERYAAAADALAAETRARVADDFAPLVGELSRARFFRDDDGDPVAFSRIAGTTDDADDARETHVSAASHAREDLLASVRRRDDGVVVEHADLSPRSSSAAEGVAEPRTRPPPAETSAPLAIGQTTLASTTNATNATNATETNERAFRDEPPVTTPREESRVSSSSRRRWSPARASPRRVSARSRRIDRDDRSIATDEEETVSRSARRALAMPRRVDASPSRVLIDGRPSVSGKRAQSARKPAVPRFVRGDEKTREAKTRARGTRANEPTREEDGEDGASDTGAADPGAADPARRPIAFVGATATGAAMCARLLDAGFPVVLAPPTALGFRDEAESRRAATLARHGATLARSPRHAAELAVLGTVEKDGACAGFSPRAWAPGVRARDARDAARRGQAPPQPTPVLVLRPGAEEEDEDGAFADGQTKTKAKANTANTATRRGARLDATTRATLEDVFAPRSPRAAGRDRAAFGGSLLVLNLNAATQRGAHRNFATLVAGVGVSFAQAATRGDPVDAEDGKMRVAVAAADVVAYEKKREARRRRDGGASVPSLRPTGAACSARKGEGRVKCLVELDRVLRAFGDAKDRLVVGEHPADAAADPGGGAGEPRDATDARREGHEGVLADSDDGDRGGDVSDDASDSDADGDVSDSDASSSDGDVRDAPRRVSEGRRSAESIARRSAGPRGKNERGPRERKAFANTSPARDASETTYAWRLADARATARARERHTAATAPALERLAFLERELERVERNARDEEASLRGALAKEVSKNETLSKELAESETIRARHEEALAVSERKHAESMRDVATANADANAARGDATAACARYEATERELGKTLVSLEDARAETEKVNAERARAETEARAEAEAATRALVVERAELELVLQRRLEEAEAAATATATADEAEAKIARAETAAAAAVASADAGAKAAAEAVATLRAKLERAESERAQARGGEAEALARLEAADAEVDATKKAIKRIEKDASARARTETETISHMRAEKENADARADAADALAASLEKSAEDARRKSLAARREWSKRERALLAERDAARAELAAAKAATRRATREAERLNAHNATLREGGENLLRENRGERLGSVGTPWRPPGLRLSPARATVSSAAKNVSLEGLIQPSDGDAKTLHSRTNRFSPERTRLGLESLDPSSPSTSPARELARPKSALAPLAAARLEAAETRAARLEAALAKADGDVAAARDAALEALAAARADLAARTAERDGAFAAKQAQTRLAESRAAERREARAQCEALAVEKAALEARLRELEAARLRASTRGAAAFASATAEETAATLDALRGENRALAAELDETLARFAALGGAETTARAERRAAEAAAEEARLSARRAAEETKALRGELDALRVQKTRVETELSGFKNGAFARAAEARVAEATRRADEKHEARAEMLLAEAAFARAGAEAALTAAEAERRDAEKRLAERAVADAVADAVAAAAAANETNETNAARVSPRAALVASAATASTITPVSPASTASPFAIRSTPNANAPNANAHRTRTLSVTALSQASAAKKKTRETASAAVRESVRDPVITTPRARLLETIRSRRLELARVVTTRRALELALEQPEVLEALEALAAGEADPSPAAALACHLVRAVLDGDGKESFSLKSRAPSPEKIETTVEEDVAAAVLGGAFAQTPIAAPTAIGDSRVHGFHDGDFPSSDVSFLGKSTSPASVRAALARCVAGDGEAGARAAAAAAAEFAAAFDAIRPGLGRALPSRMRGARLAAANERGLRDATRAVRALMMGGGFGALGDDAGLGGDDDDGTTRATPRARLEARGGESDDAPLERFSADDENEERRRASGASVFGGRMAPGSNDPLAEALFRWSACAVREWRLRRAAETAAAELARADDGDGGDDGDDDGDGDGDGDDDGDDDAIEKSPRRELERHERSPRGKRRRVPLVVRAPASPRDARKVATHGAARARKNIR